jgi:hypothetical protein
MLKRFIFAALIMIAFGPLYPLTAQDYFKDTVWLRQTDQSQGFNFVKFSNNDSLIVGHGYEMDLFYETKTGKEVKRIPGNHEVFFINNDRNFIRANDPRTRFEIFDMATYQVIDTLENDGTKSTGSISISEDEKYLISTIPQGIRVWDLKTKKILKTKIIPTEPNLIYREYDYVFFICEPNKFIGHLVKTYQDPNHPSDPNYNKTYGYYNVYDFASFDSINTNPNSRGMKISNTCKYWAQATGDKNFGVEVYDFNLKQLLWKIPINGPSLTGIEFSPDDKYLVTTNWTGDYGIKIWELETNKIVYSNKDGGFANFDVSHDGKLIITSLGNDLLLYPSRFNPTAIIEPSKDYCNLIYPNPTTGMTIIKFNQPIPEITDITLNDINGNMIKQVFNGFLEQGNQSIEMNTTDISSGTYLVTVNNQHISLTYKLLINK